MTSEPSISEIALSEEYRHKDTVTAEEIASNPPRLRR
jgi:hypothetical protein